MAVNPKATEPEEINEEETGPDEARVKSLIKEAITEFIEENKPKARTNPKSNQPFSFLFGK